MPSGTITVDGVFSGLSTFVHWNVVSFRPLLVHGIDGSRRHRHREPRHRQQHLRRGGAR
jgi:hypothetical protein